MSISAAHFNEVTNGYEKQSDGLWVHKGKLSVGPPLPLGVTGATGFSGDLSVNRGNNNGAIYFGGLGSSSYIYYNAGAWQFAPPLTGAAIADGSIGTADLAVGAAQALIGSYAAVPTFSTTTTATWLATPVSTGSIACSGAPVRVECSTVLTHTVTGGVMFTGMMVDGAALAGMSASAEPTASWLVSVAWTFYYTPTATNHTFTLMVLNNNPGTLSMYAGVLSTLYATEQRR